MIGGLVEHTYRIVKSLVKTVILPKGYLTFLAKESFKPFFSVIGEPGDIVGSLAYHIIHSSFRVKWYLNHLNSESTPRVSGFPW